MKTLIHAYKKFVSKRDAQLDFNSVASLIVFLLIFAVTIFSMSAKADDQSKTEADSGCIDCVVEEFKTNIAKNKQFDDLKAINVAIFSADPGAPKFIDPREVIDRSSEDNKQLNAIGIVTVTGTLTVPVKSDPTKSLDFKTGAKAVGTGTGFLINNCLVMTNQHVTSMENHAKYAKDLKISFSAGAPSRGGNSKFLLQSSGTVVADGNFSGKDADVNSDWAIVKLDKPIGETVGSITPMLDGTPDQVAKIPVSSASFYLDKTDGSELWGQKSCVAIPSLDNSNIMKTNCPSVPGASGSPIFAQNPQTKKIFAIGLVEGGKIPGKLTDRANIYNSNSMVLLSKALTKEKLNEIIAKNQCGLSI